jgi:hypothetical protein
MNAHTLPVRQSDPWKDADTLEHTFDPPTLEQRLRFIDLTFECFNAAKAEESERGGPIYSNPFDDEGPSERSKAIGRRTSQLRLDAMEQEGLPFSLLAKADLLRLSKGQRLFNREFRK